MTASFKEFIETISHILPASIWDEFIVNRDEVGAIFEFCIKPELAAKDAEIERLSILSDMVVEFERNHGFIETLHEVGANDRVVREYQEVIAAAKALAVPPIAEESPADIQTKGSE